MLDPLEFLNDRIAITPNAPEMETLLFGVDDSLAKADADTEWNAELAGPVFDDAAMSRVLGKFAGVFEAKLLALGADPEAVADAVAELVEV